MAKLAKLLAIIAVVGSTTFAVVTTGSPQVTGNPPQATTFAIKAAEQSPWSRVSVGTSGSTGCASTFYRRAVEYDPLTRGKAFKSLAGALSSLPSTPRNVVLYAYPLNEFKDESKAHRLISAMATASDSAKQIAIISKTDPLKDKFVATPIQWDEAFVRCFRTEGLHDIATLGTVITYANDVLPAETAQIEVSKVLMKVLDTGVANAQNPGITVKVDDLQKFKSLKDVWSSKIAYLAVAKPITGVEGEQKLITTKSNWAVQGPK